MKRFRLLLLFLCLSAAAFSSDDDWTLHLAYHDATDHRPTPEGIFALFNGNLLSYHPDDEEVRLYSKLDGFNGRNIRHLNYSPSEGCLILTYDDLGIDLFYPKSGDIIPITQIKNGLESGEEINSLFVDQDDAILATTSGIIHINLAQQEVKGYYKLGENIQCAAISNGWFYAAGKQTLFSCEALSNPLDFGMWQKAAHSGISRFISFAGRLYLTDTQGLKMQAGNRSFQLLSKERFQNVYSGSSQLLLLNANTVAAISAEKPEELANAIAHPNTWHCITQSSDHIFWTSGKEGLQAYTLSDGKFAPKGESIGRYGPRRDLCYYMHYTPDHRLLIAGGRLDPYDRTHYDGTLMVYENGRWTFFQEEGISEQTGVPYRDINCIVEHPDDPTHHFATSGGTGLYEFKEGKFVNHISVHNSPLISAASNDNPRYVRLDGLQYDAKGNLWLVNNQADTVVRALKPDGTWKGIFVEAMKNAPTCERTLIDRNGALWVCSRRTVSNHNGGLLRLDYNGTVDNTKDDVATYRSGATNQDGTSYSFSGVYCLAEDTDGAIWIGTAAGLFVIADPQEWSNSQFRITQIKVPRNDGTNLADYLLNGVPVTAISIDGAGRKWIGTQGDGLYLVSHDGTEIIENFKAESTPLLSNVIYSIAIHPETGQVMIGTDKGLCAYNGHATQAQESLEKNNLKVYPNPCRPEHTQGITLSGLTADADIKVTSSSGQVVAAGTSLGGTFHWDACGLDGSRVKPGIYYFFISTSDGKKGATAKVVVI